MMNKRASVRDRADTTTPWPSPTWAPSRPKTQLSIVLLNLLLHDVNGRHFFVPLQWPEAPELNVTRILRGQQ
jgi:hypothetical protein